MTGRYQDTRDCLNAFRACLRGDVLDYGSGGGKNRALLTPEVGSYTAFDSTPPIDGVAGDVHAAPFADGSFDVVVCNQVLEHVPRPMIVASEMFRLVREGGVCLVTAPFLFPYHADPGDYFRYTESGLCQIMTDSGFSIRESGRIGDLGTVISESIRMAIASPYGARPSPLRRRLVRYAQTALRWLFRFSKSNDFYTSAYVIATK